MNDPLETFRIEAKEHLVALEEALLELEDDPTNSELIDLSFRAMHTIKGSGGMFGFSELSDFTHHLETAFDKVRQGELKISPDFISIMLEAKDNIAILINDPVITSTQRLENQTLINQLHQLVPELANSGAPQTDDSVPERLTPEKDPRLSVYRIRFKPNKDTFFSGMDVKPILRELDALGDCYITTMFDSIPRLKQLEADQSFMNWDITLVTEYPLNDIEDVFMFVYDDWSLEITEIDLSDQETVSDHLGELLVDRGLISSNQLKQALESKPALGQVLTAEGLVSTPQLSAALNEQKATRNAKGKQSSNQQDGIVRVPAERLDTLMNLVGELVIVQARMNQVAHQRNDETILSIAEDLDYLTTEMRDNTFSIRMLPIGTTFGRFRRLVRDLSKELNKSIVLKTQGAETELDKMVIDKLADPLVHLIRNSIDHGIEKPEDRTALGKPIQGTVTLTAKHQNSQVIIQIADDGKGLDLSQIRQKAIERNIIDESAIREDDEIYNLIFEPGFSTAQQVSDVSGRGVGMDVVRRSIQQLGGQIQITTAPGQGTTFTISLPMTLAIIEGLMIKIDSEHYVLPLSVVEECIELPPNAKSHTSTDRLVNVRGELVPYLYLRDWFSAEGPKPQYEQVVITQLGQERFGFCVDTVVGQYQTVIKRLGKLYEGATGFSGATILGDGSVAMILDPLALMNGCDNRQSVQEHSIQ